MFNVLSGRRKLLLHIRNVWAGFHFFRWSQLGCASEGEKMHEKLTLVSFNLRQDALKKLQGLFVVLSLDFDQLPQDRATAVRHTP